MFTVQLGVLLLSSLFWLKNPDICEEVSKVRLSAFEKNQISNDVNILKRYVYKNSRRNSP